MANFSFLVLLFMRYVQEYKQNTIAITFEKSKLQTIRTALSITFSNVQSKLECCRIIYIIPGEYMDNKFDIRQGNIIKTVQTQIGP